MRGAIYDFDGTLIPKPSAELRFIRFLVAKFGFRLSNAVAWFRAVSEIGWRCNKHYLAGVEPEPIENAANEFVLDHLVPLLRPALCDSISSYRQDRTKVGILSGAPDLLLAPIAKHLKLDFYQGSTYEVENDLFTGRLQGLHPFSLEKVTAAESLATTHGFSLADSVAYGDHFEDRHLLERVREPVVVSPDGRMWRCARSRGWRIVSVVDVRPD